jgi:transcriptional regulator with XRE-family HTH domain
MPDTTSMAQAIRRARGSRTQAEIAIAVGVDQSTVARWETGATSIPSARLSVLLSVLGMTWADLDTEVKP